MNFRSFELSPEPAKADALLAAFFGGEEVSIIVLHDALKQRGQGSEIGELIDVRSVGILLVNYKQF